MTPGERFLGLHHEKVRRLVVQQCAQICRDRAWDLDDLVHDVMLSLVRKQESRGSRYNPARGAVSTYVVRVLRSVVGHRLARVRLEGAERVEVDEDQAPSPDESGLDDEESARLAAILRDAASALVGGAEGIGYRTLVAWLMHDREADAIARLAKLSEHDVWRYIALTLSLLEKGAAPEWRAIWHRHRMYVARRSRRDELEAFASRAAR